MNKDEAINVLEWMLNNVRIGISKYDDKIIPALTYAINYMKGGDDDA